MNPLESPGNDRANPEQTCTFGGPVPRTAGSIILPGDHDQWDTFRPVALGGVVDAHSLAIGLVTRNATLDAGHHEVPNANIGERSTHHDFVVTAARTVAVEVAVRD